MALFFYFLAHCIVPVFVHIAVCIPMYVNFLYVSIVFSGIWLDKFFSFFRSFWISWSDDINLDVKKITNINANFKEEIIIPR